MPKKPASYEYWKKREQAIKNAYAKQEAEYAKELQQIYDYAMDEIQKEIDRFYSKYATDEGITIAEAKKRIDNLDIDEYSRKAEKYVKEKNFTDKANAEMKLYNATMKINRLEMLKAKIGLETTAAHSDVEKYIREKLEQRVYDQYEKQAGILGETVGPNAKQVEKIVNSSFRKSTYKDIWSDRIWKNQDLLRDELSRLLTRGISQGKNPRALAADLRKATGASKYNAERLMRTELARVEMDSQLDLLQEAGYDEYMYMVFSSAAYSKHPVCELCKPLDGKHFKIKDAEVGLNLPPMHPNCRCCIAAYVDDKEYSAWLEWVTNGGTTKDWNKFGKAEWLGLKNSDNRDTIKANRTVSGHEGTPKKSKPNDIIDHIDKDGNVDVRTFYGSDGLKGKDVHTTNHGNPKHHSLGERGEHVHLYYWDSKKQLERKTIQKLTAEDRKINKDIL